MKKVALIDLGCRDGGGIREFLDGRSFLPELAPWTASICAFDPVDYSESWRNLLNDKPDSKVTIRFFKKSVGVGENADIDIVEWLWDNILYKDTIILKIDIGGGEYDILDKLIDSDYIKFIDYLFVKFNGQTEREEQIRARCPLVINSL